MKRSRYQFGTLYAEARRSGPDVWVYRWRELNEQGKRQLRKKVVGTVHEYRTQAEAQQAVDAFRLSINRHTAIHGMTPRTIRRLVEHYRLKEVPMDSHEGKRRSTKLGYISNLNHHILPRWGDYAPERVSTIEVEDWLKSLLLAPASRTKVRNVLSMIYRHGIRWGWLDRNPVAMVRASSKRLRRPDVLTAEEFRALLEALPERERLMGTICATTGLRVCEVLGLKWEDIDFAAHTANVLRSFVDGDLGPCKTETSQQPVPLDSIVLEGLRAWHPVCGFPEPGDWIFASYQTFGKMPMWPDSLRRRILQPTAKKVGIKKRIGWHTFRHTYSSLLVATGNDVKVVQELMRHAKLSTTMEVYAQSDMDTKRVAQRKAVDKLLDRNRRTLPPEPKPTMSSLIVPANLLQFPGKSL